MNFDIVRNLISDALASTSDSDTDSGAEEDCNPLQESIKGLGKSATDPEKNYLKIKQNLISDALASSSDSDRESGDEENGYKKFANHPKDNETEFKTFLETSENGLGTTKVKRTNEVDNIEPKNILPKAISSAKSPSNTQQIGEKEENETSVVEASATKHNICAKKVKESEDTNIPTTATSVIVTKSLLVPSTKHL